MQTRKVEKLEWEHVLHVMNRYNRLAGFVNDVDGKLCFFDGNACIDGCYSFLVTKDDVIAFINNYEQLN